MARLQARLKWGTAILNRGSNAQLRRTFKTIRRHMIRNGVVLRIANNFVTLAVLVFGLGMGQANATIFDLTLTGQVSNGVYGQMDYNGTHYDYWTLVLDGMPKIAPISVVNGDEIRVLAITETPPFIIKVAATSFRAILG